MHYTYVYIYIYALHSSIGTHTRRDIDKTGIDQGNHLSTTACLTQVFFKSGESCSE